MSSAPKDEAPRSSAWTRLARHPGGRVSLLLVLGAALLAVAAPLLPLAAPAEVHLERALAAPSFDDPWRSGFAIEDLGPRAPLTLALARVRVALFGDRECGPLLGTDELGRCVLSRIVWGSRLSLLVGLVATAISLLLGVLVGTIAGFSGGRIDGLLMRFVDILYALPLLVLVVFVVGVLRGLRKTHPDLALDPVIALFAVIGAVSWLTMARVVRAEILAMRRQPFVEAAVVAGARPRRILFRHLLPNVSPIVLVTLTLTIPRVVLLEAFLSFLGLGVEAPDVSWGLLARQGYDALTAVHASWWLVTFPGLALALTLLALNLLGDALRDAFDPRSA